MKFLKQDLWSNWASRFCKNQCSKPFKNNPVGFLVAGCDSLANLLPLRHFCVFQKFINFCPFILLQAHPFVQSWNRTHKDCGQKLFNLGLYPWLVVYLRPFTSWASLKMKLGSIRSHTCIVPSQSRIKPATWQLRHDLFRWVRLWTCDA